MDIKEIINMGGLIELMYPMLVFIKAKDFEELPEDNHTYGIFILGVGSTLKIIKADENDNKVEGEIVEAKHAVIQTANQLHDFEDIGQVPFISSYRDLKEVLTKEV